MRQTIFITGSDTGVGKTVLTALLIRRLRQLGVAARAVKPFCSGGREDAEILHAAQAGELTLDEINPWHFPEPLTPLLAARAAGCQIKLADVMGFLRRAGREPSCLLVEGAGGLLSPLGEGFSALELITRLKARPIVVCPDRLGVINQARLVLGCLPKKVSAIAKVVLVEQPQLDASVASNARLLGELLGADRVFALPRLSQAGLTRITPKLGRLLDSLLPGT